MKSNQSSDETARQQGLWDPREVLLHSSREEQALIDRVEAALTAEDLKHLQSIAQTLDQADIQDKAKLVGDTLMEIQRMQHETPNTLLQRNVWSSLDVMAMELDRVGFTAWLKDVAPKVVAGLRLDNPALVSLEHKLMLDFLGITEKEAAKLKLPHSETREVLEYAEKHRSGACGLSYITSEEFSFREFFRNFCGRPDQILEIHNSPQSKATVAIITGVVNIVGAFFCWPITVITVIVLIIVGCAGC